MIDNNYDPIQASGMTRRPDLLRKSLDYRHPYDRPVLTAVELVYFGGLEYAEAAELLKIPMGSLKTRIARSIRKQRNATVA